MKILLLDIETAPTNVYTWSLFPKYVNPNDVMEAGYTLCWAAKWLGQKEVIYADVRNGEKKMLSKIHSMLEEADAVVHYNGRKFDMPTLNREFVRNNMDPPSHYHQIDLLMTVRKQFRFESNKLDYVCQRLGLGGKVKHKGMSLWYGCMEGNEADWNTMARYNKRDVRILEKLYKHLLPWIAGHPNVGLYKQNTRPTCSTCGSTNVVKKGTQYNTTRVSYNRWKCNSCGTPLRERLQSKKTDAHVLVRTP
jgi:DNA polymerase elongation subunit (family B)